MPVSNYQHASIFFNTSLTHELILKSQQGHLSLLFATTVREPFGLKEKQMLKRRPVNTSPFHSSWYQQVNTFWALLFIRRKRGDSVGAVFVPGNLAAPIDFMFVGCKALHANSCHLYKSVQIFRMWVLRRFP
jgi:hypothetical protein